MSPDTSPQSTVADDSLKGRVICFISAKGGSGKTVLAVSTAYVLLMAGKKVVSIDCDFSTRGMSLFLLSSLIDTGSLDNPPISACLAELVLQDINPEVRPMVVQNDGLEFHVVVSNQKLREGGVPEDRFLGTRSDPGATNFSFGVADYYGRLGKIIGALSRKYDYVILDTRGGFDYTSAVPALLADYHIVVLEADEISVQQVNGLKTKLDEYAVQLEVGKKPRGFLVNKALYSPNDKLFVANVARTYGGQPIGTIPIDRLAIQAYQRKNFAIRASPGSDFAFYSLHAIERVVGDRKAWEPEQQKAYDKLSRAVDTAWRRRQSIERLEAAYPYASLAFVLLALIVYFVGTRTDLPVGSWVLYTIGAAFSLVTVVTPLVTLTARWLGQTDKKAFPRRMIAAEIVALIALAVGYVGVYDVPHRLSQNALYQRLVDLNARLLAASGALQTSQGELFDTKAKLALAQQESGSVRPALVNRTWQLYQDVGCEESRSADVTATTNLDPAYKEQVLQVQAQFVNISNLSGYKADVVNFSGNSALVHTNITGLPRAALGNCPGGGHATLLVTFSILQQVFKRPASISP